MERQGSCTTIIVTTHWSILLLLAILVTCLHYGQAAMTDPATGIEFAKRLQQEQEIVGVGVRKKGPIKVKQQIMYKTFTIHFFSYTVWIGTISLVMALDVPNRFIV
jgi:hypothetical protein